MAHPHHKHRQHHVEKHRVHHITKGYAHGGAVHDDEAEDRAIIKRMVKKKALRAEGGRVKARQDRPGRARGGKVGKKHKGTTVNVVVGGQHAGPSMPPVGGMGPPPGLPAGPPPAAAMPPPRPPMMPPPGAGGPPMMPPRATGGKVEMPHRTYKRGGRVKAHNTGGKVWNEGVKAGTHVQHSDGKNDGKDIGRKRVVTFKAGGRVVSFKTGGAVEHPKKGGMAPHLPGGAGGGEARIRKAHMAKHSKSGMAP